MHLSAGAPLPIDHFPLACRVIDPDCFVQMVLFTEDKDALQKHVDGLQARIEELEKAYKKARLSKKAQWGIVGVLFLGTVHMAHPQNHQT